MFVVICVPWPALGGLCSPAAVGNLRREVAMSRFLRSRVAVGGVLGRVGLVVLLAAGVLAPGVLRGGGVGCADDGDDVAGGYAEFG